MYATAVIQFMRQLEFPLDGTVFSRTGGHATKCYSIVTLVAERGKSFDRQRQKMSNTLTPAVSANPVVPYVGQESVHEIPGRHLEAVKDHGEVVAYKHTRLVVSHQAIIDFHDAVDECEESAHEKVRLRNTGELLYFRSLINTIDILS